MKKFEFSYTVKQNQVFTGNYFYNLHKNSTFLKDSKNIDQILTQAFELRRSLKGLKNGQILELGTMFLKNNETLKIKKTGPGTVVENYEFTLNRLTGLVAAYAFENRQKFAHMQASEAIILGLTWDNQIEVKCKLYLSAVSGTEHFYEQFTYLPLVCALRKCQLNKMTLDPLLKIAKIKTYQEVPLATVMMRNMDTVKILWETFPGASADGLEVLLASLFQELIKIHAI